MADTERLRDDNEQVKDSRELERVRQQQQERIAEHHEKHIENAERPAENAETLVHEALKQAKEKEQVQKPERQKQIAERRPDGITPKAKRAASYKNTMNHVQKELPPVSRAFSKIIHNKAVERVSEAVGSTIARPNAILAGSFMAFIFTLVIFLVARYYGYPLTGTETIAAFVVGWLAGLLFDYIRLEFTGGKS